jgi:outer membrane usher protein
MPDLAGSVMTSSDIEVYQNGFLKSRYHVPPGQFRIEDLPVSAIGVGQYDVVIRDAFGRETSLAETFYLGRSLLRPGLHAYNYGLGLQREITFEGDPQYGDPALVGQHRYGLRRWVTVGANLEASPEVHAAGVTADFQVRRYGVINFGASFGGGEEGSGGAGYLAYSYNNRRFSTNLFLRSFSDGYTNLQRERLTDPAMFEGVLRLSLRAARFTSLSLSMAQTETVGGTATFRPGVTLTQRLSSMLNLVATYERQRMELPGANPVDDNVVFLGLHLFLPQRISVDVTHASDSNSSRQTLTARRNIPLQEGYGYRVSVERSSFDGFDDELRPSGYVVYNGPVGSYRGEYDQLGGSPTWRVGTAGSLSMVDGSLFASRPLQQSFAVVQAGNVKGIRVNYNGEPAGKTRRDGKLLVPNLRSYEVNKLSINQEDLPLDYSAEDYERDVIPPPRSGAVVDFGLERLRAIYGRLVLRDGDETVPLEHMRLAIAGIPADLSWRSGLDGEFYLENIPEGSHELLGAVEGVSYSCLLEVPITLESMTDLGEVMCERTR